MLFRLYLKVISFLLFFETAAKVFLVGFFLLAGLVIILRVGAAFELSQFEYALIIAGCSLKNMLQLKATYLNVAGQ